MRNKATRNRFILLAIALGLFLAILVLQPTPVTAATCGANPVGCAPSWSYYGCCGTHLYQTRVCCNNGVCCNQFRCTASACYF